ncbi:MAG: ComF family protein [Streptococcus sp.]|nr:ComF family protein [Streptococcus sp.]
MNIICLLCGQSLPEKTSFTDLLLLKKQKTKKCCHTCLNKFQKISEQHCPNCYHDKNTKLCNDCLKWEKLGNEVKHKSCFIYNEAMKEYFSKYKFHGDYVLHTIFADILSKELKQWSHYSIVPIPLSSEKFQKRGFNQVSAILEAAKINYNDILIKKDTVSQSSKNRRERLNSQQPFALKPSISLPEKILLVDDVYTTGTTLWLAKKLLLEEGVKEILTFSLTR